MSLATMALGGAIIQASSINAQQRGAASQQERTSPQTPVSDPGNSRILSDPDKDYRINPGDVIQIQIEDAPELSHNYQVSSTGRIEMPVLGMVDAQKKTTFELARLIAQGLREGEYLNHPNVLVTVKQYRNQTFFIQGAVHSPGVYQTEGRPSLLTMISLAGGLMDNHGSTAFILRPNKSKKSGPESGNVKVNIDQPSSSDQLAGDQPGGSDQMQAQTEAPASAQPADSDYELIKVNISALYRGQFDQRVEPGDIINIPRADVFFIAGEVKAPGSFTLKEGTTLRQAVSLAQGMTFSAKASRGVIFREDPLKGARQEIKVDIADVMSGRQEDIPLMPNDVIIIPNSRTKSVGGMLLRALGTSARLPY
ncbi:MAG TPA: polysaccharide biosynthesis/export family protein [Blastocatellia bacterium]|nr:polysaccharide biosynthesis/export family protein [Blastocatellia bacterium]